MASHDFNKSWDSITKVHPLSTHFDGSVGCGKCGTWHEQEHEAEECCETCWKCGLRGHNMPDEAEDCCPCSCSGEHGFCDTSDGSVEAELERYENIVADGAARAKMKAMFGKPPKGMEDYFRRSWDSITKMPYVQGSMREMTDEDIKRWGFEDDFATRVPSDDRFEENARLIGDFIDEKSGENLPIVIDKPFEATQEALEEDKGKRRIFGSGLRSSPYMSGYIPLDHLGMNPNTATWFGRKQNDPHAVLDGRTVQQIYTPKNYRRRGMASGILDALVEAKRFGYKHGSEAGYLSTAKDSEGRYMHDTRTDEKGQEISHGRPWINTETGAPVWNRSPFKISAPSEATKDFVHLMLSRGIYPNEIRSRGKVMGDGDHEIESIDANKKWEGEGSLEAREYFDVPSWSGYIGDTEESKRARGWGLDEEQHYIRPTFGTAFQRAKLYGELRQKMSDEQDKASNMCPQTGEEEPDPITGKIHPYYEDSDYKEPDGCDCWDDWRKSREDYWAAFPEERGNWWDDEDYDEELTEDDIIPENSFHLAEKLKDFNRRVDEGEIAPAPEPVWNDEKDGFEYGGKTTQEWLDHERDLRGD